MNKDVKIPMSRSYQEFLIETLQNPEEAAGYIEVTLEEGGDEPKLLPMVIQDVVEAYAKMNRLSDSAKLKHQNLDKLLTDSGCSEIYSFVEFLDALGFRLAVTLKEDKFITEESPKTETINTGAKNNAAADGGFKATEASQEEVAS
ncbi:transcriptional regulator [Kamptonema animale CS-326]|jgi:DNA-binding phage protein|uniref:helix-turn-helix domain-containing transcriptional regulator n=1 Tax=Kamptonema animale TaxID=92934 RepID=UPI00232D0230|nr:transcriptional regulator [Kamptonema animale]MDB9512048.1 transcriptional regulator [Kamptonema animale CS-326]